MLRIPISGCSRLARVAIRHTSTITSASSGKLRLETKNVRPKLPLGMKNYGIDTRTENGEIYKKPEHEYDPAETTEAIRIYQTADLPPDVISHALNSIVNANISKDFSIYYQLKGHQYDHESLKNLIVANPGRAKSSWELYTELYRENGAHYNKNVSASSKQFGIFSEQTDNLHLKLLEKLLNGEKSDEDYIVSVSNLSRAIKILGKLSTKCDSEPVTKKIIEGIVELRIPSLINIVDPDLSLVEPILETEIDDYSYLTLYDFYFKKSVKSELPLDNELLTKGLNVSGRYYKKLDNATEDYNPEPTINEAIKHLGQLGYESMDSRVLSKEKVLALQHEIIDYITSNKLDQGPNIPALELRLKIIDTYGFVQNDYKKVMQTYHEYSKQLFQFPLIQNKIIQICCYFAVLHSSPTHLKVAEAMLLEEIPINTLKSLILAHSEFDVEQSRVTYFNYIQSVSRTFNVETQSSPSGILTEAVLLSYIFNDDREFAFLINDKAIDNGIVKEKTDIERLKGVFKLYGQAMEEEDFAKAKALIKQKVLQLLSER